MNMGEVVELNMETRLDIPPERVLKAALDGKMKCVVVLGIAEDGSEYFASSVGDGSEILWFMERAKLKLLSMPDNM